MKVLFVCTRNQRRSVTAERIFRGVNGFEVRSAGTERGARHLLSQEEVEWADVIFAMEHKHVQHLKSIYKQSLAGKRLVCLEIPDKYGCMTPELIDTLRKRLSLYLDLPAA